VKIREERKLPNLDEAQKLRGDLLKKIGQMPRQ